MLTKGMFTSTTGEWSTPQDVYDDLDAEFGFTLDPCATPENAKCERYFTKDNDGLAQDWAGVVFFGKQDSGLRPGAPLLIDGQEWKAWPS